eukprot:CAMPEP_0174252636 /NCGR_PEP_ID=MMETSP0439-20130205/2017_1 /TAXON_ID=0 /ORGANISM="Stereomyxa ramosa, Strain Chinc5" /LENGTH=960 /DNA_ID=CAMNT_0015333199 /DNA_START=29 /DNA_END=2908 /DNA_ORIENTATION=-
MEEQAWVRLQRVIFTRWVNQKLLRRNMHLENVVTDMLASPLVALVEELGEVEYDGPPIKPATLRVRQIDNLNNALEFLWRQGVELKNKPQAENFVDGDQRAVLASIFAMMLSFLKIGDAEDTLNFKDALLHWARKQTQGYEGVELKGWKSFKDGLALCALIHKHRPQLIGDWDSLDHSNAPSVAFAAAEKYFGLEQYLEPGDLAKMDEMSTVVYVSEYYYGIYEQRKLDLAAKKIGKVIQLTITNDALREKYAAAAAAFKKSKEVAVALLSDRTVDNTMAGAKKRLEDFYNYKETDNRVLIAKQFECESIFNELSMSLAHNNRPEFVPPEGLSLRDIEECMNDLEKNERERKAALHRELNRQHKLIDLDQFHEQRFNSIKAWNDEKEAYLNVKEEIDSVSEATLHIKLLDNFDKERDAVASNTVVHWKKTGDELESEKYENLERVRNRESEVDANLDTLAALSAKKRPVLLDDLAREEFRVQVGLKVEEHTAKYKELMSWIAEKEAYLNVKEEINNISDAQVQITLLEAYEAEKVRLTDTGVAYFKDLGAHILAQKYETEYSSWVWEQPELITGHESDVANKWAELAELSGEKRRVLDGDLEREEEKERLRIEFAQLAADYVRWSSDNENNLVSHFGFTLAEVEAYAHTLEAQSKAVDEEGAQRMSEINANWEAGQAIGVTENKYTEHNLDTLAAQREKMEGAIAACKEAYEKELERQRRNDALCREYAGLVDPFLEWVASSKASVSHADSDLDAQLAHVESLIASLDQDAAPIAGIQECSDRVEAAGVVFNEYSSFTPKDIQVLWTQYQEFLSQKKQMLEQEIETSKLKGITPEEFKEIEENFQLYDEDSDGKLGKGEVRACLYSVGEEKTRSEIDEFMEQWGDESGDSVSYDQYLQFMIDLVGITATKDDILGAFDLINRGNTNCDMERMSNVMKEGDLKYFTDTAPTSDDGHDYVAW